MSPPSASPRLPLAVASRLWTREFLPRSFSHRKSSYWKYRAGALPETFSISPSCAMSWKTALQRRPSACCWKHRYSPKVRVHWIHSFYFIFPPSSPSPVDWSLSATTLSSCPHNPRCGPRVFITRVEAVHWNRGARDSEGVGWGRVWLLDGWYVDCIRFWLGLGPCPGERCRCFFNRVFGNPTRIILELTAPQDEILHAILPEELGEVPSSFTVTGHIGEIFILYYFTNSHLYQ